MSSNNFDEVLTSLQEVQDAAKLLKLLIEVRKKIDSDCNRSKENIVKIREKGAFKQIVTSLQISKKGVINVSLSILGNCCLDSKCARDVIKHNMLSSLNLLLKRYPKDDSINGRVFRIVGNLCQHTDQWSNVILDKKPQIVIHIDKFLKDSVEEEENEKVSEATITMGVRALRELLNKKSLEVLVKTYGVLKTVGVLLIKYGSIWQSTKKAEGVVLNIIKLLHEYSRYRYYPSILEMRTTNKGDSIAYLSKVLLVAPKQVIKIVMNFLKISHLKSDLPVPEIFDSFVEVLRDESIIREFNSTCEECLRCLCHLLDHPGNRENERCGESIPLLVDLLKKLTFENNRKIECCLLIISTLNKCRYSTSLIAEQIRCNIVTVINEKLQLIVGSVEPLNVDHKSDKKRKTSFLAKIRHSKKSKMIEGFENEEVHYSSSRSEEEIDEFYSSSGRCDYSPASSSESDMAMSWTSGLSPPSSPRSRMFELSESDSDDYSPVCSEVDPNEFALLPVDEEDYTNPEPDSKHSDDIPEEVVQLPSFDVDSSTVKEIKAKLIVEILYLLKTYTKIKPPLRQLGTPELLWGLVKSSGYFETSTSPAVLIEVIYRILEPHDYFLPLIKSDFIPSVYDLTKPQHGDWCSKCRQFQSISVSIMKKLIEKCRSGGSIGDIAHMLARGDNATKQQLVLVIPYIMSDINTDLLVKLMVNCGGLEILMKLLKDDSHLRNKSIKVLCILASKKLRIPNPQQISTSKFNAAKSELSDSSVPVTFKLDDGSLLHADRELLSKKSDFFARLLNGDFKESSQDVITLPNVSRKALTYILQLIKCGIDKTELVDDIELDLPTHLDVIGLCDRFLMEDYRVCLTDCVKRFRLSSDTIPVIYNWSLQSQMNLLRVECITFALVSNITDSMRFVMFKHLFELGCTEELVEDIRSLLVHYMTKSIRG